MDVGKLKYSDEDALEIINEFRLYTEYIWEIKEEMDLQQDEHLLRRDDMQEILEADPTAFTKSELEKLKEADQFVLDHIEEAVKWFHFWNYKTHPKSHWWNYVKYIANGEIKKPNLDKIYKEYFEKLELLETA